MDGYDAAEVELVSLKIKTFADVFHFGMIDCLIIIDPIDLDNEQPRICNKHSLYFHFTCSISFAFGTYHSQLILFHVVSKSILHRLHWFQAYEVKVHKF